MLKLRLKRTGKKRSPSYRLVIMENLSRRDGRPIDEVGYYDPISKKCKFDGDKIKKWLDIRSSTHSNSFQFTKKSRYYKLICRNNIVSAN